MRLLNTTTIKLRTFDPTEIPDYAILSHRWGPEEVTFKDITGCPISDINSPARQLTGFSKLEGTCRLANKDGYDWVWIDSCCIDKESSSDVDKSINSMWTYYIKSNVCYVYMMDIPDSKAGRDISFQNSDWFRRGWTLQELIAPVFVQFYAADWSLIGTKLERHEEIAKITTIDSHLLAQNKSINIYTAAERFSWAAHRQVTHEEDEAYSLLGLFQIQMPMLYGEGRARAFARLQEAIYLSTCDDSIFLFRYSPHAVGNQPLLADCSTRFCQKVQCEPCQLQVRGTQCFPSQVPYDIVMPSNFWTTQPHEQIMTTVTPFRNEMSVPLSILDYTEVSSRLMFFDDEEKTKVSHVAVLNHTVRDYINGAFCLLLYRPLDSGAASFYRNSVLPALLPDIREFTSRMPKTKILVPGPVLGHEIQNVDTIFSVFGDSYHARVWNATRVDSHAVLRIQESSETMPKNAEFKVQTRDKNSKSYAEVSCRIADSRNLNEHPQILVRLERIVDIWMWSIKEVLEVRFRKRKHKQCRLFLSKTPSDGCKVCLSDGKELYVGLRRLAVNNHPQHVAPISQQRYQIFIRLMQEGHRGASYGPIDVNLI